MLEATVELALTRAHPSHPLSSRAGRVSGGAFRQGRCSSVWALAGRSGARFGPAPSDFQGHRGSQESSGGWRERPNFSRYPD